MLSNNSKLVTTPTHQVQSELPADQHWMLVCNIFPVQSEKEPHQNKLLMATL